MKKNWFVRSAVLMFALVIVSCSVFGGTLAKYSWTSGNLTETARVAKFDFVFGADTARADLAIDLFKTAYKGDADGTTANDTVWSNKTDDVIAPGTKGGMDLAIKNTGEVAIKVSNIKITETKTNDTIAIKYSLDQTNWKTAAEFNTAAADATADVIYKNGTANVALYWMWDFADGTNDTVDTPLGDLGTDTVKVDLAITVDQVD